jgi:hypothetical protein
MTYHIDDTSMLVSISRSKIIDISVNDVLSINCFGGIQYQWTDQDRDFMENNPDDDIFLKIEKTKNGDFKAVGIFLHENQKHY